ncbi:hypothetical protein Mal4_07910 [Maioricimonas rarisocia]|uniref:Lipoprotein n=1 Tax=Maioricimonas rarisocia TaxID=2528026 RepID=A0A517Z215_9PLAN|nr:hypothetical protein [Maioricimonas rarisocia]QDU36505.1 hypothetical protein Mal4_07910 [Maioricimonas rarisocia]
MKYLFRIAMAVAFGAAVGCASVSESDSGSLFSSLQPGEEESVETVGRSNDPWVNQAGHEARKHLPREKTNDPLGLRNIFMSERARDIEHNLGID